MDFLLLTLLVLGLIAWWVIARVSRRRRLDNLLSQLTTRVYKLERQLEVLVKLTARVEGLERQLRQPSTPTESAPRLQGAVRPQIDLAPPRKVSPLSQTLSSQPVPPAVSASTPRPIETRAEPPVLPSPPKEAASSELFRPLIDMPPSSSFSSIPSTVAGRLKSVGNLEETVGTNWLSKLGVIILVLGIAFFLAYQLRTLGPAGKITVGFLVGAVLLGLGAYAERRDRYRIVARAGIGGGWALVYFTTYAMYHVQAARVLSSESLDLLLLLLIAAAMVLHTLRYRSQVVTGLAFLLGFLTVTVSRGNVYSLAAGAILALALAIVVVRMGWFEMEVFGIAAAFLNHYLWLRPIIAARGPHPAEFPGYLASSLLLTFYWLVFRCSYVIRKIETGNPRAESISTVAALLNAGLYIWLMGYQSAHPELAFQFFVFVGAVELGFGQLPITRRRRAAFLILTTLGVTLLVAAFPFKFSGSSLSLFWLAEAEALFLAGAFTSEILFRRLAVLTSLSVAGQLIAVDAARVMGQRWDGAHVGREVEMSVIFAFAAVMFYVNAVWLKRRNPAFALTRYDALGFHLMSYAGATMLVLGAWLVFPHTWTAVAWSAIAVALASASSRLNETHLTIQANILALAAIDRTLLVNLSSTAAFHHIGLRLLTVSLVAGLIYLYSRWSALPNFAERALVSSAYTWLGSTLIALLLWYELRPVSAALGWTILGLALLELGIARRSLPLRLQAYVAFASSFLRIFFVNLNAGALPGAWGPRLYTTLPLALAFVYVYFRFTSPQIADEESFSFDRRVLAPQLHSFFSTIAVLAMLRFEVDLDWVAAAWAASALVLAFAGWRSGRRIFLDQAFLAGLAASFRTVAHNLYERSYFPAPVSHGPWLCAGVAIALLFAAMFIAFPLKLPSAAPAEASTWRRARHALHRHPEQFFFFAPFLLLTLLLATEMRKGMVTVSWGVEAVAVFLFALWIGQRSFRLAGLGLLLVCVGKIVTMDVWRMQPRDRYITFIALGCALLLVSFLYTRYRETLRQYL